MKIIICNFNYVSIGFNDNLFDYNYNSIIMQLYCFKNNESNIALWSLLPMKSNIFMQ